MEPELIRIKGFLPFLDETIVDLRKVHTALTIGQIDGDPEMSQGAGKSSWIEAMDVCFFGKAAGRCSSYDLYLHDDIRGHKKAQFELDVIFKMEGNRYRKRRHYGYKSLNELEIDRNNGELEEAIWESYTGEISYDTDSKLCEVLGLTHKTYKSVVHLAQKENVTFISDAGSRKEILRELLGVEEYDKLSEECQAIVKKVSQKIEVERRVTEEKEKEYEENYKTIKEEINALKTSVERKNKDLKIKQKKLKELIKEIETLKESSSDREKINSFLCSLNEQFDALEEEIENGKEQINELKEEIEVLERNKEKEKQELLELAKQFKSKNSEISKKKKELKGNQKELENFDKLEKERKKLEEEKERFNTEIIEYRSNINRLQIDEKDLKSATNCPILKKHCDLIVGENREKELAIICEKIKENKLKKEESAKRYNEKQKEFESKENEISELKRKESEIEIIKKDIQILVSEKERVEAAQVKLESLDETFDKKKQQKEEKIENYAKKLNKYEKQSKELKIKITDLEEKLEACEDESESVEEKEKEYEGLKEEIEDLQNVLKEEEIEFKVNEKELGRLERLKKEAEAKRKEVEESFEEISIYEKLAFAFGKNGCQKSIMKNAVPNIENEANNLLKKFSIKLGHNVRFELDPITKDGSKRKRGGLEVFVTNVGGKEKPIENYSGGETEKITLAIILALSRTLTKRAGKRIDTLIIDEKFVFMDSPNKQQLIEILESISNMYKKVIISSHLLDLKAAFEKYIVVKKSKNKSTVEIV